MKCTKVSVNTKFLGLQITKHLNWNNYIIQMFPKSRGACYVIRPVVIRNTEFSRVIYFVCFQPVIKRRIFWEKFVVQ